MSETENGSVAYSPLTVIVVTYNSAHVIEACLQPLLDLAHADRLRVLVVDNDSGDDTVAKILKLGNRVSIVEAGSNLGFAKAVQLGVNRVQAGHICLLNPDAVVDAASLVTLSQLLSDTPRAGIVAPNIQHAGGRLRIVSAGNMPTLWRMATHYSGISRLASWFPLFEGHYLLPSQATERRDVEWVTGACMIFSRATWDDVGGMSTRWFMYAEDVDFCYRVRSAGLRVILEPGLLAVHSVGGSSSSVPSKVNSMWIVNLFDFYSRELSVNGTARRLWIFTVVAGLISRSAFWMLRSRLAGDRENRQSMRFAADARALLRESRNNG